MNTNIVRFWDPVPSLNSKTFSTIPNKVNIKAADKKVITVNADRNLPVRLFIAANTQQVNRKEV